MFMMSEASVGEFVRSMSEQRVEVMRTDYEADLRAAWKKGKEAGKLEEASVKVSSADISRASFVWR